MKGLRVELLTELFQRMGYKYIPEIYPWARALKMVKSGSADGIASIWYRPERESFLYYPTFPFNLEVLAIYQPVDASEIPFTSLEDFTGLSIGTIRGFSYPKEFLDSSLFKKDSVTTDESNFKKLAISRIDAIISYSIVGDYTIKRLGLRDKVFRNTHNYNEGIWGYVAFSKQSPEGKHLADEYDRVILELINEGFYQNIFWKYLDRGPDKLPEIERE